MASKRAIAKPLFFSYAGCSTCRKAQSWLNARAIDVDLRPIVESPPTFEDLAKWVPKSDRSVRKWLNTSGQSYRALDKGKVAAASDDELLRWLAKDGKLIKRPVLVTPSRVLVGFNEDAYAELFED